MSETKAHQRGHAHNIANMRMKCGVVERGAALFHDRNGNPISNAEVIREVDAGWRYFWSRRGGLPRFRFGQGQ